MLPFIQGYGFMQWQPVSCWILSTQLRLTLGTWCQKNLCFSLLWVPPLKLKPISVLLSEIMDNQQWIWMLPYRQLIVDCSNLVFSHWPQQSLTLICPLLCGCLHRTELKSSSKSHITLPAWCLSSSVCYNHLYNLSDHSCLTPSFDWVSCIHLCVFIYAATQKHKCGKLFMILSSEGSCWYSGDGQDDFWRSLLTSAFLWFQVQSSSFQH